MSDAPWHRAGWLLDRLRELVFHVIGLRGLAFASTLGVTLFKYWQSNVVPEGAISLLLVTGGIYTGAWLGSKVADLKLGNGPPKPGGPG